MGYIQGEGRNQGTLFPVVLDDFVPADHVCRVIDAFVEMLVMSELALERAQAAETGRPGYDPRDLLKLYLYCYLNQIRSSRRLEAECRRNFTKHPQLMDAAGNQDHAGKEEWGRNSGRCPHRHRKSQNRRAGLPRAAGRGRGKGSARRSPTYRRAHKIPPPDVPRCHSRGTAAAQPARPIRH